MTYLPVKPINTVLNAGPLSGPDTLMINQAGVAKLSTLSSVAAFVNSTSTSTGATGGATGATGATGTTGGTTGSTGATAAPTPVPAFVAATQYQTANATFATGGSSVSVSLPGAATSGSIVLLMASGAAPSTLPSPGAGWTEIVSQRQGYGYAGAWFAQSTVMSSGPAVLSGISDVLNVALIETSAKSFEAWYGPLSGGGGGAVYGLQPQSSFAPSLRYGMITSMNGGVLSGLSGATSIASYAGKASTNNPTYWAGTLFSIANSATAVITATPAATGQYLGQQPSGLIINVFGASISGLAAHYAYTPSLTPTPAVIPGPVGGRPQYYTDYLARWRGGQTLPAPKVQMYNGPATQFTEKANFFYWLQRSVDVLEFAAFTVMSNTTGDDMYNSAQYAFGYQLALGAKGENSTFSIGVCTNDTTLFDVAAGYWDSVYAKIAQMLIARGGAAAEIRLGWEMNESYYAFTAQYDNDGFRNAFRRIVYVMRQQPGAQFLFSFAPLLVGQQTPAIGYPDRYLPGSDAIDFIAGDYYPSSYMWGSATALADQHAGVQANLFDAPTASVSWMDKISQQYGVPMTFPEFAAGNTRDDGYGVGDDVSYLVNFHEWQRTGNKPAFRFGYWESSGGGTNARMHALDDGSATPFPLTAAQYASYYRGPVLDAGFPARPAAPINFVASGNLASGIKVTYDTPSRAGGAPQYMVVQFSESGQNKWTSWNWVGLGSGQSTGPTRTLTAGTTAVDVRMLFANSGGVSAWAQVTVNLSTGTATGTSVIYSSAYGNSNTSIADPTIQTPPALPPVPAGTASAPAGSTGSAGSSGGAGSTTSSGATTSATAAITDITGHTFNATLPNAVYTYYQNESGLNANVFVYSDGGTGWVIAPSDANLIPKIVLTKNGNPVAATGFTDITNL